MLVIENGNVFFYGKFTQKTSNNILMIFFSISMGTCIQTNIATLFIKKILEITLQKFNLPKFIFSFHSKTDCTSTFKINRVRVNLYIPYFTSKQSNGRNPNYPSNIFNFVLIVFADHENIRKNPKFMILLCTVQKLWLFLIYPKYGHMTIFGHMRAY